MKTDSTIESLKENEMTLKHQYSTTGQHRIVELDIAGFLKESGEWTGYQNIATYITKTGIIYACVTDYFGGGPIKADAIYQLSKTDFKSEKNTVAKGVLNMTA